MSQEVVVRDDSQVRWIELNRPDSRNGLTPAVNEALYTAFEEAAGQRSVRTVVFTGRGGHFCSGLDLKDAMRRGPQSPEQVREALAGSFHRIIRAIRHIEVPVIAAIDGAAVGFGCDLALACDMRWMSERAFLGEIFVKRGLMPDGGGTYHLPRLVGVGRALDMMLSGRKIDAEEAERVGLASRRLPADGFFEAVHEAASQLAKGPPLVYRNIKNAVYASLDSSLDEALAREAEGQAQCVSSKDFVEGISAFLQKRDPEFRGE